MHYQSMPMLKKMLGMILIDANVQEGTVKSVKYHIETLHLKKVSLTCKFCDKTFSSRNAAISHTEKQHSDLVKNEIDAE